MWKFYHDITQAADIAASQVPTDGMIFVIMGIVTIVIVLAPSYFEKNNR